MNKLCTLCNKGKIHITQISETEALTLCDNDDCDYFFEATPEALTIKHEIPSTSVTWDFIGCGSRCSSAQGSSSGGSHGSLCGREIQNFLKPKLRRKREKSSKDKQSSSNALKSSCNPSQYSNSVNTSKDLSYNCDPCASSNYSLNTNSNPSTSLDNWIDEILNTTSENTNYDVENTTVIPKSFEGHVDKNVENPAVNLKDNSRIASIRDETTNSYPFDSQFLSPSGSGVSEDSGFNDEELNKLLSIPLKTTCQRSTNNSIHRVTDIMDILKEENNTSVSCSSSVQIQPISQDSCLNIPDTNPLPDHVNVHSIEADRLASHTQCEAENVTKLEPSPLPLPSQISALDILSENIESNEYEAQYIEKCDIQAVKDPPLLENVENPENSTINPPIDISQSVTQISNSTIKKPKAKRRRKIPIANPRMSTRAIKTSENLDEKSTSLTKLLPNEIKTEQSSSEIKTEVSNNNVRKSLKSLLPAPTVPLNNVNGLSTPALRNLVIGVFPEDPWSVGELQIEQLNVEILVTSDSAETTQEKNVEEATQEINVGGAIQETSLTETNDVETAKETPSTDENVIETTQETSTTNTNVVERTQEKNTIESVESISGHNLPQETSLKELEALTTESDPRSVLTKLTQVSDNSMNSTGDVSINDCSKKLDAHPASLYSKSTEKSTYSHDYIEESEDATNSTSSRLNLENSNVFRNCENMQLLKDTFPTNYVRENLKYFSLDTELSNNQDKNLLNKDGLDQFKKSLQCMEEDNVKINCSTLNKNKLHDDKDSMSIENKHVLITPPLLGEKMKRTNPINKIKLKDDCKIHCHPTNAANVCINTKTKLIQNDQVNTNTCCKSMVNKDKSLPGIKDLSLDECLISTNDMPDFYEKVRDNRINNSKDSPALNSEINTNNLIIKTIHPPSDTLHTISSHDDKVSMETDSLFNPPKKYNIQEKNSKALHEKTRFDELPITSEVIDHHVNNKIGSLQNVTVNKLKRIFFDEEIHKTKFPKLDHINNHKNTDVSMIDIINEENIKSTGNKSIDLTNSSFVNDHIHHNLIESSSNLPTDSNSCRVTDIDIPISNTSNVYYNSSRLLNKNNKQNEIIKNTQTNLKVISSSLIDNLISEVSANDSSNNILNVSTNDSFGKILKPKVLATYQRTRRKPAKKSSVTKLHYVVDESKISCPINDHTRFIEDTFENEILFGSFIESQQLNLNQKNILNLEEHTFEHYKIDYELGKLDKKLQPSPKKQLSFIENMHMEQTNSIVPELNVPLRRVSESIKNIKSEPHISNIESNFALGNVLNKRISKQIEGIPLNSTFINPGEKYITDGLNVFMMVPVGQPTLTTCKEIYPKDISDTNALDCKIYPREDSHSIDDTISFQDNNFGSLKDADFCLDNSSPVRIKSERDFEKESIYSNWPQGSSNKVKQTHALEENFKLLTKIKEEYDSDYIENSPVQDSYFDDFDSASIKIEQNNGPSRIDVEDISSNCTIDLDISSFGSVSYNTMDDFKINNSFSKQYPKESKYTDISQTEMLDKCRKFNPFVKNITAKYKHDYVPSTLNPFVSKSLKPKISHKPRRPTIKKSKYVEQKYKWKTFGDAHRNVFEKLTEKILNNTANSDATIRNNNNGMNSESEEEIFELPDDDAAWCMVSKAGFSVSPPKKFLSYRAPGLNFAKPFVKSITTTKKKGNANSICKNEEDHYINEDKNIKENIEDGEVEEIKNKEEKINQVDKVDEKIKEALHKTITDIELREEKAPESVIVLAGGKLFMYNQS